jgi:RsiW-degrading membrane proteinase PrsW (M82 family)
MSAGFGPDAGRIRTDGARGRCGRGQRMNELQVTFGGQSHTFEPGQTVRIGRSTDNDIVVTDPTVSRQHAQLTWGPSGWLFENLGLARTFRLGQNVTQVLVSKPTELSLASPHGPVVLIQPPATAGEQAAWPDDPRATRVGGPETASPGGHVGYSGHHGGAAPRADHAAPVAGELAMAFEILVPVKSWVKDAGWRQGLRLLVIVYALLPLVFLAIFSTSGSLSTPGLAYSLYIAPLWAIAFWLLLRPGRLAAVEIGIGIGIIVWVTVWLNTVTINVNDHLVNSVRGGNFLAALAVGYNEELTKALPVLLAALILLKYRSTKLDVRMWMLLGTIAGLTFGVLEERSYTEVAIAQVASAHAVSQADAGVLDFAFRVFVDGFQHAIWAGVSAFFIGMAVNYPRRRWQLVLFGVSIAAVLHALNDWSLTTFNSYWPWIVIQAISLLLFIGYTMSATSIERQVRRTPLFRGDSILMDVVRPDDTGGSWIRGRSGSS